MRLDSLQKINLPGEPWRGGDEGCQRCGGHLGGGIDRGLNHGGGRPGEGSGWIGVDGMWMGSGWNGHSWCLT